jgi:hypothetical protein
MWSPSNAPLSTSISTRRTPSAPGACRLESVARPRCKCARSRGSWSSTSAFHPLHTASSHRQRTLRRDHPVCAGLGHHQFSCQRVRLVLGIDDGGFAQSASCRQTAAADCRERAGDGRPVPDCNARPIGPTIATVSEASVDRNPDLRPRPDARPSGCYRSSVGRTDSVACSSRLRSAVSLSSSCRRRVISASNW